MKKIKQLSFLLVVIMTMSGVCGCMNIKKRANFEDRMLAHINEKYDDNFTYKGSFGGGAGVESKQILCSSEKYPGEDVLVMLYTDENGKECIVDNYVGIKYKQETIDLLGEVLAEVFDENYKLFYENSLQAYTKGATNEMTFSEYIAEASSGIGFTAIVSNEYTVDQSEVERRIEKALVERGINCGLSTIYFDNGSGAYEKVINFRTLEDYLNKRNYDQYFEFIMMTNKEFDICSWG